MGPDRARHRLRRVGRILRPRRAAGRAGCQPRGAAARLSCALLRDRPARTPQVRRTQRVRPHVRAQDDRVAFQPAAAHRARRAGPQPRRGPRLLPGTGYARTAMERPAGARAPVRAWKPGRLRGLEGAGTPRRDRRMETHMKARRTALIVAAALAVASVATTTARGSAATTRAWHLPIARHVFVVNLENKGFAVSFGSGSPATFLNGTLRGKGQLLDQYYGVAHNSLPNYIAQISGQGPNPQTQGDCQVYSQFVQVATANGQAVGDGCVFPAGGAGALSPPRARRPRQHPASAPRRSVRRSSQPVRLLPLDHRHAELRVERRPVGPSPERSALGRHNNQPRVHHAEPLQRRTRRTVCRRATRWLGHRRRLVAH